LRWSELEFVDYCHNSLSPAEQERFESHISECRQCRERFTLSLDVILMESLPEESLADQEMVNSSLWQDWKKGAALTHSRAVQQKLNRRRPALLKMAAMLFLALLPLALTYSLVFKPFKNPQSDGRAPDRVSSKVPGSDLTALAEAFEAADRRFTENPQDREALLERAVLSERLFLFEDAKKDYQNYLEFDPDSPRRIEIEGCFKSVAERITDPPSAVSLYDQLDKAIDLYLSAHQSNNPGEAAEALNSAEQTAVEMESKSGEHYGLDTIAYYRGISSSAIGPLIKARGLVREVEGTVEGDQFTESISKIGQAREIFERFGAETETERAMVQNIKFLNKTGESLKAKELSDIYINRAVIFKHLFIEAQLWYRKGEALSDTADFDGAGQAIAAAVRIAEPLGVPAFLVNSTVLLASIYYITNNNAGCLEQGHKAFEAARAINHPYPIQLFQVLGISAFNLSYPRLAERYLQYSIKTAQAQKSIPYEAVSHAYFGIIRSEQKLFSEAEENFAGAFDLTSKISDERSRIYVQFNVTGYYARSQMLAGNTERAIHYYTEALDLAQRGNIQQNLELSQLHQGRGECLMARGDLKEAEAELSMAVTLNEEAHKNMETNNSLLTFSVTHKTSNQQLRSLRYIDLR
jgi:tetratricopeptide (TPR) repeat protein